jgi:hypothetical protein
MPKSGAPARAKNTPKSTRWILAAVHDILVFDWKFRPQFAVGQQYEAGRDAV